MIPIKICAILEASIKGSWPKISFETAMNGVRDTAFSLTFRPFGGFMPLPDTSLGLLNRMRVGVVDEKARATFRKRYEDFIKV